MKLTYLQSATIMNAINKHLNDLSGDLAIEVLEVQMELEVAFKAHTARLMKLQAEIREINAGYEEGELLSKEDRKRTMGIDKEVNGIYKKEKEFDITPFPVGGGGDRDLKQHLNLGLMKDLKPILTINKTKKDEPEGKESKA